MMMASVLQQHALAVLQRRHHLLLQRRIVCVRVVGKSAPAAQRDVSQGRAGLAVGAAELGQPDGNHRILLQHLQGEGMRGRWKPRW